MTKQIPLTRGKFALVDDEDYEFLMQWKWQCFNKKDLWYACRASYEGWNEEKKYYVQKRLLMHREIMSPVGEQKVDHRNGNGLDNRRDNLRICSQLDNTKNQKIQNRANKTSKYKGVSWHKRDKIYQSYLRCNGKLILLGRFDNETEAAMAYNEAAIQHFGEFAKLNSIGVL